MSEALTAEDALRLRWRALWQDLRLSGDADADGDALIAAWSAKGRTAHTLEYLGECLLVFDEASALAFRPLLVELAVWFHHAVRDTTRADSEVLSALWAERVLTRGGLAAAADEVRALILATRHDAAPLPGDAALTADIARAILGAEPERFDRYNADLRWEYRHVPAPAYRGARRQAIAELQHRPAIFNTEALRKHFEQPARDNLARALRHQWRIR